MKLVRALGLMTVAAASTSASFALSAVLEPPAAPEVELLVLAEVLPPERATTPTMPRPEDPYAGERYDLEELRSALAADHAAGVPVDEVASTVLTSYLPTLMEHWVGTKYSYSGTSQVPKRGKIACGYYVSTVLEHAGFSLDRVEVARQASEQIIRTFVPDPDIQRFRGRKRKDVVAAVEAEGPGVYLVGLDTHVGFLVNDGEQDVQFCHSTRLRRRGVVCEEAVNSRSLKSRYTVLGRLDNPVAIDLWLEGDRFVTARKGFRQAPAFGALPEAGPSGGPRLGPSPLTAAYLP